jgi:hypothetical protein
MEHNLSYSSQNHSLSIYWLVQGGVILLLVQSVFLQSANAQAVDLDSPFQSSQQPKNTVQKTTPPRVIKLKLNDLTGVSEWIRAEVTGNKVKLLHTVVAQSGLSRVLNSLARIPPIAHTWYDHPTTRIFFQPNGCQKNDCVVVGTDSIILPDGTDVYQGQFTLEYRESGWLRTITFKLPQ